MPDINVQSRINKIRNEQRAQKVATQLNFGALAKPENTPEATYYGNVQNFANPDGFNARFIATFTRTDSVNQPPQVDFPYDYKLDKYLYDDLVDSGGVVSVGGRDKHAIDEYGFSDILYEVGQNYVKREIKILFPGIYWTGNGTGVRLVVQAISPVKGTLKLERVE